MPAEYYQSDVVDAISKQSVRTPNADKELYFQKNTYLAVRTENGKLVSSIFFFNCLLVFNWISWCSFQVKNVLNLTNLKMSWFKYHNPYKVVAKNQFWYIVLQKVLLKIEWRILLFYHSWSASKYICYTLYSKLWRDLYRKFVLNYLFYERSHYMTRSWTATSRWGLTGYT